MFTVVLQQIQSASINVCLLSEILVLTLLNDMITWMSVTWPFFTYEHICDVQNAYSLSCIDT